ncbi:MULTISPECIES: hypothetical protein [Meridianimaribacter]|uniref:Uncharacterized protein n=1 Tax=Meridianimaribacter flavus TaxID=571115 RepID=A0ABY2G6Z2_9FLAO|nr:MULTISPECIES: hypothetical protein [Meridianimaribacter]TDY11927.1 hypothetical protein A8975_1767 [Meridianimaribacter flavus]
MKKVSFKNRIALCLVFVFLLPMLSWSQKRIKPPKRASKVESVDAFVNNTFELYHKVFVYDSLVNAGVEIPAEIEDELVEHAEQDVDSLLQIVPDLIDDISDAPFMRQAKATLNLNKAKKALKYCGITIKTYFVGTKEEEDEKE